MFTVEGRQVPIIPFDDVVGRVGTAVPAQMVELVPKVNVGVIFAVTATANDAVVAHCPAVGMNR